MKPDFDEIYNDVAPSVYRYLRRLTGFRAQAEDIAQETFLRAYTQLSGYEGRGSFEGWLTRIATNICLNMLRAAKRRPESPVADLTDDEVDLTLLLAHPDGRERRRAVGRFVRTERPERALVTVVDGVRVAVENSRRGTLSIRYGEQAPVNPAHTTHAFVRSARGIRVDVELSTRNSPIVAADLVATGRQSGESVVRPLAVTFDGEATRASPDGPRASVAAPPERTESRSVRERVRPRET